MDAPSLFPNLPLKARPPFYFALRPDTRTATKIQKLASTLAESDQTTCRVYPPDRLHVSLCPVGWKGLRRGDLATAIEAASGVEADVFGLRFEKIMSLRSREGACLVLHTVLRSPGLEGLVAALRQRLLHAGLVLPQAGNAPHVTLSRQTAARPETTLDTPIEWTVRDFVLARLGGSAHDDLGCWRLK